MAATLNRAKNGPRRFPPYEAQTRAPRPRSCYGPRLVKGHSTSDAARLAAVFTGVLLLASVPVALAADAGDLRSQAAGLRGDSGSLDARVRAATLQLYSLDAELGRARAELAGLEAERAALAGEQASARAQLAIAKRAVSASQTELSALVRALYQRPGNDPLAVLLGASSLEEALSALDGISRAAGRNNRIVEQAREARTRLATLGTRLAERGRELERLAAAAESRAAALAASKSERQGFLAGLRRQQGLNAARIASIESRVRDAEVRTAALAAAAPAPALAPVELAAPLVVDSGPRTLTVSATGYTIRGRTATGMPTAPGVVAVDPAVIPLGTKLTIPGYGVGIAADTGGAVQGNVIDVWFPTAAQALQWGRRTVTITIH
jgi:3D (Asp-Asp-Asp) domain-containing protein/peptidoglycan hydrolase CwlO-like protein